MSKPYNLGDLARRLKFGGKLSTAEREHVLNRAKSIASDKKIHSLAMVFALSEPPTPENVALVAPLLTPNLDDYDLWGIILALCSYWNLTDVFQEQLFEIVTAPNSIKELRQASSAALVELGELAYNTKSPNLFARLLELYAAAEVSNDLFAPYEQARRLEAVHKSIDVAVNGPRAIINYIDFRVPDDLNAELIKQARVLASKSSSN